MSFPLCHGNRGIAATPVNQRRTKFQEGDIVKLTETLKEDFRKGDIVEIYSVEAAKQSDPPDPDTADDERTNANTAYGFRKYIITQDVPPAGITTEQNGQEIAPHAALSYTKGGTSSPEAYRKGDLVWTIEEIPIKIPGSRREFIMVPRGTLGRIEFTTTFKGGLGNTPRSELKRMFYVVKFNYRRYQCLLVKYPYKLGHQNFERASSVEKTAYTAFPNKPLPPIVLLDIHHT